jgi:hypothetical protein
MFTKGLQKVCNKFDVYVFGNLVYACHGLVFYSCYKKLHKVLFIFEVVDF